MTLETIGRQHGAHLLQGDRQLRSFCRHGHFFFFCFGGRRRRVHLGRIEFHQLDEVQAYEVTAVEFVGLPVGPAQGELDPVRALLESEFPQVNRGCKRHRRVIEVDLFPHFLPIETAAEDSIVRGRRQLQRDTVATGPPDPKLGFHLLAHFSVP